MFTNKSINFQFGHTWYNYLFQNYCLHFKTPIRVSRLSIHTSTRKGVCPTILRPVQRFVGVQPALQLNDSDLMKEPAYAATIIQDIITGGITEPTNFHKWLNTLNVINGSYLWAANAQLSRSAARGS